MDLILTSDLVEGIISTVICAFCCAVSSAILVLLKKTTKREVALRAGIKILLHKIIVDDYNKFVLNKMPITVDQRNEVQDVYNAYKQLGGNGTGDQMFRKIQELDIKV